MFDSIRRHQRLLQLVLLLLIFPAFAFFGISGYDRFFSDSNAVATVDGSPISAQEYAEAQRQQLERMQQLLGGAADPSLLNTAAARREILDALVTQRALALESTKRRVSVPDARVRELILEIPGLKGPDGKFDVERYRTVLAGQGKSEAGFEYELRGQLMMQTLPDGITESARVPRSIARGLLRATEQKREVAELRYKPEDFIAKITLAEGQVRQFYEKNPKRFERPESATVEYVVLSADDVARGIKLSPDEVRTSYEQNRKRYTRAEQRRASHILIAAESGASKEKKQQARAEALAVLETVRGGKDFAEVAKEKSEDTGSARNGGDLGFFTRDAMVKAFADRAFTMKEGEVSDLVETEFGFHIIKLTAVKAGEVQPFDAIKAQIDDEIRRQRARGKFAELAEGFSNTVYEVSDSLKPAAEKFGLTIRRQEHVGRQGAPDQAADSPLNNAKLLKALFSPEAISERRNTEAIDIGSNRLVSARIIEHKPSAVPSFETIEAEVSSALMAEEAAKLAQESGRKRLEELSTGGGEKAPSGFSDKRVLDRNGATGFDSAAMDAIFRLSVAKVPGFTGVDRGGLGFSIFHVTRVIEPEDTRISERLPEFERQLTSLYARQELDAYLETLRGRSKVELHPERIASPQN